MNSQPGYKMATDNNWIIPPIYEDLDGNVEPSFDSRNIEAELEHFRQQWCRELSQHRKARRRDGGEEGLAQDGSHLESDMQQPSKEEEAKYLFLQGVNAEESNKLYEAIHYYRRAVQLVPDIEFRISDYGQEDSPCRDRLESESSEGSIGVADEEDLGDLIQHFSKLATESNSICKPKFDQQGAHISDLPMELIQLILMWVVSSDLDVVSLEKVAMVNRGFYLAAREERLWKSICERVWGVNCGSPKTYGGWRNMYITRPHLRFYGCYISRMAYYRQGERGLDNFYKPFHLVEYFRYVRFFPEGKILMMTTPDNPYTTLPKLRTRQANLQGLLTGYYKMAGNQVTAVLTRVRFTEQPVYRYKRSRRQDRNDSEQVFYVEFVLSDTARGRRSMLSWIHYSLRTKYKSTGQETVSEFELTKDTYPNLIFSQVRSYTAQSTSPLSTG